MLASLGVSGYLDIFNHSLLFPHSHISFKFGKWAIFNQSLISKDFMNTYLKMILPEEIHSYTSKLHCYLGLHTNWINSRDIPFARIDGHFYLSSCEKSAFKFVYMLKLQRVVCGRILNSVIACAGSTDAFLRCSCLLVVVVFVILLQCHECRRETLHGIRI